MSDQRYVALIRGINVGGRNPVPMAALRDAFTEHGFTDVSTYIQSGNVLFSSTTPPRTVEGEVEAMLERHVGSALVVAVRSEKQFRSIVAGAPEGFGEQPDTYHSDVLFLRSPLTATTAMGIVELREGVDHAWPGTGAVYFQRLSARRTASRMGRLTRHPEYQLMTIRSWSTVTKLLSLLDAR